MQPRLYYTTVSLLKKEFKSSVNFYFFGFTFSLLTIIFFFSYINQGSLKSIWYINMTIIYLILFLSFSFKLAEISKETSLFKAIIFFLSIAWFFGTIVVLSCFGLRPVHVFINKMGIMFIFMYLFAYYLLEDVFKYDSYLVKALYYVKSVTVFTMASALWRVFVVVGFLVNFKKDMNYFIWNSLELGFFVLLIYCNFKIDINRNGIIEDSSLSKQSKLIIFITIGLEVIYFIFFQKINFEWIWWSLLTVFTSTIARNPSKKIMNNYSYAATILVYFCLLNTMFDTKIFVTILKIFTLEKMTVKTMIMYSKNLMTLVAAVLAIYRLLKINKGKKLPKQDIRKACDEILANESNEWEKYSDVATLCILGKRFPYFKRIMSVEKREELKEYFFTYIKCANLFHGEILGKEKIEEEKIEIKDSFRSIKIRDYFIWNQFFTNEYIMFYCKEEILKSKPPSYIKNFKEIFVTGFTIMMIFIMLGLSGNPETYKLLGSVAQKVLFYGAHRINEFKTKAIKEFKLYDPKYGATKYNAVELYNQSEKYLQYKKIRTSKKGENMVDGEDIKHVIENYKLILSFYKKEDAFSIKVNYSLAYAYEKTEQYQKALKYFEAVQKAKGGIYIDDLAISHSSYILIMLGKKEEAFNKLVKIENKNNYPECNKKLALLYFYKKQYAKAIKILEMIPIKKRKYLECFMLGESYWSIKKQKKAVEQFLICRGDNDWKNENKNKVIICRRLGEWYYKNKKPFIAGPYLARYLTGDGFSQKQEKKEYIEMLKRIIEIVNKENDKDPRIALWKTIQAIYANNFVAANTSFKKYLSLGYTGKEEELIKFICAKKIIKHLNKKSDG